MKKLLYLAAAMLSVVVISCSDGKSKWQEERDSLLSVNEHQRETLDELSTTLADVSSSLDSITIQENLLTENMHEKGTSKKQMIAKINSFKNVLAENKAKMLELEKKLSGRDDQLAKMSKILKYLNEEIAKKEATINQLMEEVAQKNSDIENLTTNINTLNTTIDRIQGESDQQKRVIANQTESLNTVYFIMGEKSDLKAMGVLAGGFLAKKKVDYKNLDMTKFTKADMRNLRTIQIPSASPTIMSGVNTSACTITKTGKKSSELVITDPAKFWSSSKVLVIKY